MAQFAVIGANGFLGKNIVNDLLNRGNKVTCVYHKNKNNLPKQCQQVAFSDFLEQSLPYNYIVFAAGSFQNSAQELIDLNYTILLKLAKHYGKSRILYVSSVNVYGSHHDFIKEDSAYNNPTIYAQSKLAGELIVSTYFQNFSIVRLTYLYGPGLNNQSFIPTLIEEAMKTGKITIRGKGDRQQDYLYIDDASDFCINVLINKHQGIFIAASGVSYSNLDVAKMIATHFQNCPIQFIGEEKGTSYRIDPSVTFKKLNWKPSIKLIDGLKRSIQPCAG